MTERLTEQDLDAAESMIASGQPCDPGFIGAAIRQLRNDCDTLQVNVTSLCDRLDEISGVATLALRGQALSDFPALGRIALLSEGFMRIPPATCCGERHAEPEVDCPSRAQQETA